MLELLGYSFFVLCNEMCWSGVKNCTYSHTSERAT